MGNKECKGNIPEDIKEIITTIGAYILKLADKGDNLEENKLKILENIKNGKGRIREADRRIETVYTGG